MKALVDKKNMLQESYNEYMKYLDNLISKEVEDHDCQFRITEDCPPYDYIRVCKICGHTK